MCKHDGEFKLLTSEAADRPPAAFYCSCGFNLCFDPVLAGSVRHANWSYVGVAYRSVPSERHTKTSIPLSISRF